MATSASALMRFRFRQNWRRASDALGSGRGRLIVMGGITGLCAFGGLLSLGWLAGGTAPPPAVSIDVAVPRAAVVGGITPPGPDTAAPAPETELVVAVPTTARPSAGGDYTVPAVMPSAFAGLPAVATSALPPVPDPRLTEVRHGRALPRIGADGRQPWRVYARPFDRLDDRARIAIVVVGLGLSATATDAVIHYLPADITLAFDAYADNPVAWAAEARSAGHEVLLALPMRASEFPFVDTGPQALSLSLHGDENRQRLEYLLGLFPGYVGVVSDAASDFTLDGESARALLSVAKQRGLLYLEARQPAKATTLPLAADLGAARVGADLWIDEELTATAIDERLARLEALARARFVAVGMTRPKPLVVQRLVAWSARLNPNELVLAPVSAVAAAPVAQPERAP